MKNENIKKLFDDNLAGAIISPNKLYRYALWRVFDEKMPLVNFVGLNPSTANIIKNDRTISRLIKYTKDWGYGGFYITNLFALRDKSPKELLKYPEVSIGLENDRHLSLVNHQCKDTVFMWGNGGTLLGRDKEVIKMFPLAKCFGKTKEGHPKHPLYLEKTITLIPFNND